MKSNFTLTYNASSLLIVNFFSHFTAYLQCFCFVMVFHSQILFSGIKEKKNSEDISLARSHAKDIIQINYDKSGYVTK